MLDVLLVGTGGMTPLPNRYLSSLLVRYQGKLTLIDCGEGTQISIKTKVPAAPARQNLVSTGAERRDSLQSLKMVGWGFKEIGTILLSHCHADHVAGLPGLLLTVGNSGRRDWVVLYGPPGVERVVDGVRAIAPQLPFPLEWRELVGGEHIDLGDLEVSTLVVDHGVPCLAYSLYLPRAPRFNPDRARELGIPTPLWSRLQGGETVEWNGRLVRPDEVLGEKRRGIRLSYVTDTRPTSELPAFVEGSDLLICEGMYGSPEELPKAEGNKHMLFSEAATIARDGHVRELWLTHYSPSLSDPEEYLDEATRIFPNTRAGYDRMETTLRFGQ